MSIAIETFEKAKSDLITLSQLDCLDSDYTANKMKHYFDTYFASAFFVKDQDFKAYLKEDMADILNREELIQADEDETEFVRARLESTLDVYATIIRDTENKLKQSA